MNYQDFMKRFLKEIRPFGECRDGGFSFVETDLPFSGGEVQIEKDTGFELAQYDFDEEISYVLYTSCTGSKINMFLTLGGRFFCTFENVGFITFSKFMTAFENFFRDEKDVLAYIGEDGAWLPGLGPGLRQDAKAPARDHLKRYASYGAHLNPLHPQWIS